MNQKGESYEHNDPRSGSLKTRLKATWMAGDYGRFAKYLEPGALQFLSRISIEPSTRVLDVACGAGQIPIPMVREGQGEGFAESMRTAGGKGQI